MSNGKLGKVPKVVAEYLIKDRAMDSDWVGHLQAVTRGTDKSGEIRIFDKDIAGARKVNVKDYTSLDTQKDLILYQGTFDEGAKKVELRETIEVRANQESLDYTFAEVWQKIAGMREVGSNAIFYLRGSPCSGGPFGRGAAIAELNPNYADKKGKKYILYLSNMDGKQLTGTKEKFMEFDKAKDIADWIHRRHVMGHVVQ